MEDEVEGRRAEVDEGCEKAPVLCMPLVSLLQSARRFARLVHAYLALEVDSPEGVEQLQWFN